MKRVLLFLTLLLSLAAVFVFAADVDEKDVIVLTEDNFDEIVNKHELMLVEFYAPWCGHCKQLTPEYAEAATILASHEPPIALAKLDATQHGKIAQRFGVNGYPSLKVFRNGKDSEYKGPRKAPGIVAYMKKQVGPAAKPLETEEEIEEFIKSDPQSGYAVVGFFGAKATQLLSSFAIISNKLRDNYVFGKVTKPELAEKYGVKVDSLVAFKNYDDKKVVYEGEPKTKEVEEWVRDHSLPIVGHITHDNMELYQRREMPIAKFFMKIDRMVESNQKQSAYFISRLKKAALKFKNEILVATIKIKDFEEAATEYGLAKKDFGLVIEKGWQDKYKFDGKFSADAVMEFFQAFVDDELEKFVKSEDVPTKDEGHVKKVVGKNFNQIVNDPEKDVFIEFYAPWCGHCRQLEPKYEQLAKKLKNVNSLVIAKIDATANDFPREQFDVGGYPTIYLKPAGKGKKVIKYDGAREVEDMTKWLQKKVKIPFEKKKKNKK